DRLAAAHVGARARNADGGARIAPDGLRARPLLHQAEPKFALVPQIAHDHPDRLAGLGRPHENALVLLGEELPLAFLVDWDLADINRKFAFGSHCSSFPGLLALR